MRTHEQPKYLDTYKPSLRRSPYGRRKQRRLPGGAGVTGAAEQALRTRLAGLVQEHRDLDAAISVLFAAGTCDDLAITRMKKRKLQLKDEIARLGG